MDSLRRLLAVVSLCLAGSAQAVTLYSGLARPKASQAIAAVAPKLPAASVPTAAGLPGSVSAAALPQAGALPEAASAAAAETTLGLLGGMGARSAGGASPDQGRALGAAFDHSLVAYAAGLFHPLLPAGQAPAVAARNIPVPVPEGAIPSEPEMRERMEISPLTNPEREAAVISLYKIGGAAESVADVGRGAPRLDLYDTIQRQDAGRGRNNLIVVKKGSSDRLVVVGAHHDKVHEGAGTIDNWTGATMVTNLYQAMKDLETEATIVFVAFAREEEGLLGSEAFLRSLPKVQQARINSMVNLDTLGVDGTFSWKNNSTRALLDLILQVAAQEKRDLVEAYLSGGDSDSSTFRRAGIAAMTIFGASQEVIFDIIHTAKDTIAAFSLPHYRNAYLLTLALLRALDRHPIKGTGVA